MTNAHEDSLGGGYALLGYGFIPQPTDFIESRANKVLRALAPDAQDPELSS